jgi:hypothetical protein
MLSPDAMSASKQYRGFVAELRVLERYIAMKDVKYC